MKLFPAILVVAALALVKAQGAATQFYGVTKGHRFTQTTTGAPVLRATQGYRAQAFIYATAATTGSVQTPRGVTKNLALSGDHVGLVELFDTQGAFDTPWNSGSYTLALQNAADGARSSTKFLGADVYPAAPHFSNFAEAQNVDSAQPFTLRWDALGIPAGDFAKVRVELDGVLVFETSPILGAAGALGYSATSVTIPTGRLIQGQVYHVMLTSFRSVNRDTTTIPGATGYFAYASETTTTIRTRFTTLDMSYYGVEKRVRYNQSSAAAPVPRENAFELAAFGFPVRFDSVRGASMTGPAGGARAMQNLDNNYTFAQSFATQAAMESAFPAGGYSFSFDTRNNGVRTNILNLAGNVYPSPPQISNFDAAQRIRASDAFTLTWTIPGATANDFVRLVIHDGISVRLATAAQPGTAGALSGANVSFVIPAGTLQQNRSYTGTLSVSRQNVRDSVNYLGALGVAGFGRVTQFPLAAALPAGSPEITNVRRVGNETEFTFNNVVGQNYTLQSAAELPNWSPWIVTNSNVTPLTIRWPASTEGSGFYRIVVGP
jgi:hypothetical protein